MVLYLYMKNPLDDFVWMTEKNRRKQTMVDEVMKFITEADPEVGEAIEAEAARQRRNLELIASENIVSEPVMMAMGSY